LVTGAADDDPSGIATYSQAGAQFGYGLLWTVFLTTPFMIAIQLVSAQIGRVTGKGIVANVKDFAPRWLVISLVSLLVMANTFNNLPAELCRTGLAIAMPSACVLATVQWKSRMCGSLHGQGFVRSDDARTLTFGIS
jgi:Mn2+/Fe2+ NRAMP family transporter